MPGGLAIGAAAHDNAGAATSLCRPERFNVMTVSARHGATGLALWLLVTYATAAVGGLASANAGAFYRELMLPPWAPPPWLFAPVWTALYLLMAVAAWRVWMARGFAGARTALSLFVAQLVLNALWTWLFFAWRRGALACADIVLLWLLILATLLAFWRVRRSAALLLLPYLAWVSFATALSYAAWQLNRAVLG